MASTSPLAARRSTTAAKASSDSVICPSATAIRDVMGLAPTSTMCASPASSTWVSFGIGVLSGVWGSSRLAAHIMSDAYRIQLKPKRDRRIASGHPWVFSNEIASDIKAIPPGGVVDVVDAKGKFLGRGYGTRSPSSRRGS